MKTSFWAKHKTIYSFFTKSNKYAIALILIFLFSFAVKARHLSLPNEYYFDEIYYGFTAGQYAKGNMDAWVYDTKAPEGFSYTWDHPPTGKLLMSIPIRILGDTSLARRIMPLIFGSALPLLAYFLSITLFPNKKLVALFSALFVSLDGLVLSMSRIALVDVILTAFILLSATFLWKDRVLLAGLFFGLAVSTKWTGVFVALVFVVNQLIRFDWDKKKLTDSLQKFVVKSLIFGFTGILVYLISYTPMIQHFGWQKFIDLQKQMYWFHTNLEATHPNQSPAYTWLFDKEPVWFWVNYDENKVSNIYAMGNPILFWGGALSVLLSCISAIKTRSKKGLYLLMCYFVFWVPLIFSSRIMFLYHYLPSVPFLAVCTALVMERIMAKFDRNGRIFVLSYSLFLLLVFVHFYPVWTGAPVNKEVLDTYFWFESWR